MSERINRMLALLDRLIDWFIPAELSADMEMRKQARMFLISHLFGPFIGNFVPLALYLLDPDPGYDVVVLAASITAFWAFPFVLRSFGHYNLLALISIQNLIFCILWSCFFYGGVTSPTLPWVLTIPLLAFFYLGSSARLRLAVMTMFAANVAAFSVFSMSGYSVKNDLPLGAMQGLGMVSTVAAALYVAMMAIYYAKIQASQTEIENEMREHLATASELRLATEEAERASAAKAEFLARMSHELRTPLNAVIGYSQILLEDAEDDGDTSSIADLNKIHSAGHHLLKLVNEVLDLSKIEAGKMELNFEQTDLAALLSSITAAFAPVAAKSGNTITCTFQSDLGQAMCDASKFRNILGQLLDNGLKFTQNGTVEVLAERRRDIIGDELVVHIVDTGIGIAPAQMAHLFENFTVVDDSSTSKYGGTGLGLALSQRLIKLMGGDISVDSQLGRGSRFTIRLPLIAEEAGSSNGVLHREATLVPSLDTPQLSGNLTAVGAHA